MPLRSRSMRAAEVSPGSVYEPVVAGTRWRHSLPHQASNCGRDRAAAVQVSAMESPRPSRMRISRGERFIGDQLLVPPMGELRRLSFHETHSDYKRDGLY